VVLEERLPSLVRLKDRSRAYAKGAVVEQPPVVSEENVTAVEAAVNEAVGLCVVRAHAAAVGFSSVNKFYRVFKKLVGATPSEYRRRRAQRAVLSCVSSRPRAIHV
jgi:hypothetical protein